MVDYSKNSSPGISKAGVNFSSKVSQIVEKGNIGHHL